MVFGIGKQGRMIATWTFWISTVLIASAFLGFALLPQFGFLGLLGTLSFAGRAVSTLLVVTAVASGFIAFSKR